MIFDPEGPTFRHEMYTPYKAQRPPMPEDLRKSMDPAKYVGRAPIQVTAFLENVIKPALEERKDLLGVEVEINV